jgi:hypothetical protein
MEDCFADVTREGEWLGWCGWGGTGVISRRDQVCVKFVDVGNVVGANGNGSNRLGGAGKGDSGAVFTVIGCKLGAAVHLM